MTTQDLRSLINQSLVLSEENRNKILNSYESLSPEQVSRLTELLSTSIEKQNGWFKEAFKTNPNLLENIKDHLHKANMDSIHTHEEESRHEEENTLYGLEEELNNMFN